MPIKSSKKVFGSAQPQIYEMLDLSKHRKAVFYGRSSTTKQEESVSGQLGYCNEYAEAFGVQMVDYYADEGQTGRNDERPGLRALMKELENPGREWDLVIVYRLDRFFRNSRLFMEYSYRLSDYGVYLVSAQERSLNNTHQMAELMRLHVAQQAEMESQKIGENVMRGKLLAAQAGKWQGGVAPLGYDVVDGTLVINAQERLIVEKIFQYRDEGYSLRRIADTLNRAGSKSKAGNAFKETSIREILTNPVYKGDQQYNRSASRNPKNGKLNRHAYKPEDEIIHSSQCPAIVTEEVFDRVQPKQENKRRSAKSTKYLLSGLVVCKECGKVMHVNKRRNKVKEYISFYCENSKKHKTCTVGGIDLLKLEECVLVHLRNRLFSADFFHGFLRAVPTLDTQNAALIANLKKKRNGVIKSCNNLLLRLENDCPEEVVQQIEKRVEEKTKAGKQMKRQLEELEQRHNFVPVIEDLQSAKEQFMDYCQDEKNKEFVFRLIHNNVEKIEVDQARVYITYFV